jgi:hypothetical protein
MLKHIDVLHALARYSVCAACQFKDDVGFVAGVHFVIVLLPSGGLTLPAVNVAASKIKTGFPSPNSVAPAIPGT